MRLPGLVAEWDALRLLRDAVNKGIEQARNAKAIGASLEAHVTVASDEPALAAALTKYAAADNAVDELRYILLTSGVTVAASADEVAAAGTLASLTDEAAKATIGIATAAGTKCERCWNYETSVGTTGDYPGTCSRCGAALAAMNFPAVTLTPAPAPEAAAAA